MAYIIKKATYTNGIRTGLERIWDTTKKHCIVLMKSPSTADDMTDDITTKRITGILRHNGYGVIRSTISILSTRYFQIFPMLTSLSHGEVLRLDTQIQF